MTPESTPSTGVPRARPGSRPPHLPHRGRQLVMAALIFIGGGACGAALATIAAAHGVHHHLGSEHPDDLAGHMAHRLASYLNMTDAQIEQVLLAVERRQAALSEIRREIQPRLEVELTILENDIAAVLDEEQRVKWREHVAQMRKEWLLPLPESSPGGAGGSPDKR